MKFREFISTSVSLCVCVCVCVCSISVRGGKLIISLRMSMKHTKKQTQLLSVKRKELLLNVGPGVFVDVCGSSLYQFSQFKEWKLSFILCSCSCGGCLKTTKYTRSEATVSQIQTVGPFIYSHIMKTKGLHPVCWSDSVQEVKKRTVLLLTTGGLVWSFDWQSAVHCLTLYTHAGFLFLLQSKH